MAQRPREKPTRREDPGSDGNDCVQMTGQGRNSRELKKEGLWRGRRAHAVKVLFSLLLALLLAWLRTDAAAPQASPQGSQENQASTGPFKLLTQSRGFILQFVSDGKTKQVAIPRDWLIPPQDEKDDESYYVTSFHYDKGVSSFPIGNGRMGLHFSSYEIQAEGSAQGAAGRDVFLIFDPKTSAVSRGGIERGITKERIRSQGCFEASMEHYFLADVDGDGLTDIGVVKEELLCLPKQDADGEAIVGPFYKKHQIVWYVFEENAWKLEPNFSGKFPEHYPELPLIGIDKSPVDFVGCTLWQSCDRTKWPSEENDQQRKELAPEPIAGTAAVPSRLPETVCRFCVLE